MKTMKNIQSKAENLTLFNENIAIDYEYFQTLNTFNKVLYKTAYNFEVMYVANATRESAHQAGIKKIKSINKLNEDLNAPQTYVDLSTGKRFTCTENELTLI